uniref:Uncharacterized protein n=1 Tax=Ditylenchus dipsaci TaxID=166011 RepID=A0A915E2C1_9BILA
MFEHLKSMQLLVKQNEMNMLPGARFIPILQLLKHGISIASYTLEGAIIRSRLSQVEVKHPSSKVVLRIRSADYAGHVAFSLNQLVSTVDVINAGNQA